MSNRYQAQTVLFSEKPSYAELISCSVDKAVTPAVHINVWRNHAFEPIVPLMEPYAGFGVWSPDFRLSHYDDTLSFLGHEAASVELIWLDLRNLVFEDRHAAHSWLVGRLEALRSVSTAPIVLATWESGYFTNQDLADISKSVIDCYYADIAGVARNTSLAFLDKRTEAFAGTPLARGVQPLIARQLACCWLPAACLPPIKAIALDLDQTLHQGILGEDGFDNVVLTAAHKALQESVKALSAKGIFVALVSRNEYGDVEELFSKRADYPLRWTDFSAIEVSWSHKGDALLRIAEKLRISPDAIVYVDDNPGELLSVTGLIPSIHTIYADQSVDITQRALEMYPGLWRWSVNDDDSRRLEDMKANELRKQIFEKNSANEGGYFSSLGVTLAFSVDDPDSLPRMADLSAKTNQFNLSVKRYTQADLDKKRKDGAHSLITVSLQDKLSNSGIVALLVLKREGRELRVNELCISCRALGRGLEDSIIFGALSVVAKTPEYDGVIFEASTAPRNQPAIDWLYGHIPLKSETVEGDHRLPVEHIRKFKFPEGLKIKD